MIQATAMVSDGMGGGGLFEAHGDSLEDALTALSWKVENCYDGKRYTGRIAVSRGREGSEGLSAKARNVLQVERRTLFWNGTVEII